MRKTGDGLPFGSPFVVLLSGCGRIFMDRPMILSPKAYENHSFLVLYHKRNNFFTIFATSKHERYPILKT